MAERSLSSGFGWQGRGGGRSSARLDHGRQLRQSQRSLSFAGRRPGDGRL